MAQPRSKAKGRKRKLLSVRGVIGAVVMALLSLAAGFFLFRVDTTRMARCEELIARRDRALATVISAMKASRNPGRDDALSNAMEEAVKGSAAKDSPLIYAAFEGPSGEIQKGWLNLVRFKIIFPGEAAKAVKNLNGTIARLSKGQIVRQGKVKELSVQLPGRARVKLGFEIDDVGRRRSGFSFWLKAAILFGSVLICALVIMLLTGGGDKGEQKRLNEMATPLRRALAEDSFEDPKQMIEPPGQLVVDVAALDAEKTIGRAAEVLGLWRHGCYRLARYLPKVVVNGVLKEEEPGAEERAITAIHVALHDFERQVLAESARNCLELANSYLDLVMESLDEQEAVVGHITPSGVTAWWGAPLSSPDPEGKAVLTGLSIMKKAEDLSLRRKAARSPVLGIGVGIATGRAVAGRIGSARQMHYTVVGQPVVAAASLADRAADGEILVCQVTRDLLDDGPYLFSGPSVQGLDGKPSFKLAGPAGPAGPVKG